MTQDEIITRIKSRFKYLDTALDEDQDINLYTASKELMLKVFEYCPPKIEPMIGVDDDGLVNSEWHISLNDGGSFIFMIIPHNESRIKLCGLMSNHKKINVFCDEVKTLDQIKNGEIDWLWY